MMFRPQMLALSVTTALLGACGGSAPASSGPIPGRPIAMNSEQAATLTASDPQLADHGSYHVYSLTSSAGQNVQFDVMSTDFDAFAILQNAGGMTLMSANGGGDGNNARITFVLPGDGEYRLVVTSNRPGGIGNYRVRVTTLGGVRMIAAGRNVIAQLQPSDPRLPDNFLYQSYTYSARAAETVTIEAESGDFDPYIMIQDAGGTRLASDDDSGEGRNARLHYTFPYQGSFRILVGTYNAGRSGTYSLSVH